MLFVHHGTGIAKPCVGILCRLKEILETMFDYLDANFIWRHRLPKVRPASLGTAEETTTIPPEKISNSSRQLRLPPLQ